MSDDPKAVVDELLKRAGMETRKQLLEALGCASSTLSNAASGEFGFGQERLQTLAKLCKVSVPKLNEILPTPRNRRTEPMVMNDAMQKEVAATRARDDSDACAALKFILVKSSKDEVSELINSATSIGNWGAARSLINYAESRFGSAGGAK